MHIPVFVSCPTALTDRQNRQRELILEQLGRFHLEPRALGRSDYPTILPLREVVVLAHHCSGCVVLGFEQFHAEKGIRKRGTPESKEVGSTSFPTEWNQMEAGILFAMGVPLLVFREKEISGGIFDPGVSDVFVHQMPDPEMGQPQRDELSEVFLKWQADVRGHYYGE